MKYKLEQIIPKKKYYEVYIKADSNDGDYITTIQKYDQEYFDEVVDEIINLKNNYMGSHQLENYHNVMDLDIPYNGWDGYCHTLEKLKVTMYDVDGKIYNVVF